MKVTLYSRDGTVFEEIECLRVEPYCGSFRLVVFKESKNYEALTVIRKCFITNLPFSVEGTDWNGRQPDETDVSNTVKLLNDSGDVIREWRDALAISFQSDVVSFKCGDTWHSVCGNILIQPDEEKP